MIRLLFTLMLALFTYQSLVAQQFEYINRGHSHNDYTRKRPLLNALNNGYMSIEVDVFLKKGDLKVAHTKMGIRKRKTLVNMYLAPLLAQYREYQGKIYHGVADELVIMIDLKTNEQEVMIVLDEVLSSYKEMLTVYENGSKKQGAVRIILSGGDVKYTAEDYAPRYFSIDGGMDDIESGISSELLPRVSAHYGSLFSWNGKGAMPEEEKELLIDLVNRAHANGRKIRFWALPNHVNVWKQLLDAGVDWINVDDLEGFREFYLKWKTN